MSSRGQLEKFDSFFTLIKAGLWENEFRLSPYDKIDWQVVYQLAQEQSVLGLVLAGVEHCDIKPPQDLLLEWIGEVQMTEQQNKAMNEFIAVLIEKLRSIGVYALLVKGQGIAQCYERPLWRLSGDVDLLLSHDNYRKSKQWFDDIGVVIEEEKPYKNCEICGGTGYITYTKKIEDSEYMYGARCICGNIPSYKGKEYYLAESKELNLL